MSMGRNFGKTSQQSMKQCLQFPAVDRVQRKKRFAVSAESANIRDFTEELIPHDIFFFGCNPASPALQHKKINHKGNPIGSCSNSISIRSSELGPPPRQCPKSCGRTWTCDCNNHRFYKDDSRTAPPSLLSSSSLHFSSITESASPFSCTHTLSRSSRSSPLTDRPLRSGLSMSRCLTYRRPSSGVNEDVRAPREPFALNSARSFYSCVSGEDEGPNSANSERPNSSKVEGSSQLQSGGLASKNLFPSHGALTEDREEQQQQKLRPLSRRLQPSRLTLSSLIVPGLVGSQPQSCCCAVRSLRVGTWNAFGGKGQGFEDLRRSLITTTLNSTPIDIMFLQVSNSPSMNFGHQMTTISVEDEMYQKDNYLYVFNNSTKSNQPIISVCF